MIAARISDIRSFFVFCRMGHLFANGIGGWWHVPKVGFIVEPRGLAQPHCPSSSSLACASDADKIGGYAEKLCRDYAAKSVRNNTKLCRMDEIMLS